MYLFERLPLARIIEIPYEKYEKIFDKNISPKYEDKKNIVKANLKKRLNYFREAACYLEGFEEFYESYSSKGTNIHNFWCAFWEGGESIRPKKLNPTPSSDKKRLKKSEEDKGNKEESPDPSYSYIQKLFK